jgi:SAM-dependent methyltransferase
MKELDAQKPYWDAVAELKTFAHPLNLDCLQRLLPKEPRILDFGCGYGRTCAELHAHGYRHVIGLDISEKMIARGRSLFPELDLRVQSGDTLDFPAETFDACILFAVLTCIVTDSGQQRTIAELNRILRPGGVLYVSDYPLQADERNRNRYQEFSNTYKTFGVFQLPDGGVVRHHDMDAIHRLLSAFEIVDEEFVEVLTMNSNSARVFQIVAQKK